jgi:hypothetical protein
MFGDWEEKLLEVMENALNDETLEDILERLDLTPADVLVKLIMDGHILEEDVTRAT